MKSLIIILLGLVLMGCEGGSDSDSIQLDTNIQAYYNGVDVDFLDCDLDECTEGDDDNSIFYDVQIIDDMLHIDVYSDLSQTGYPLYREVTPFDVEGEASSTNYRLVFPSGHVEMNNGQIDIDISGASGFLLSIPSHFHDL